MNAETWFAVRDRIAALEWALDAGEESDAVRHFTSDAEITFIAADGVVHTWGGNAPKSAAAEYSRFRRRGVIVADRMAWTFTPVIDEDSERCRASHIDLCVSIIKGVGSTALRSITVVTDELVREDGEWRIRRRTVDAQPSRGGALT